MSTSSETYLNYATFLTPMEGPERALQLFSEGVDFAERRGLTFWRMGIKAWELGVLFEIGEWDRLLSDAKEVVDWDPEKGLSVEPFECTWEMGERQGERIHFGLSLCRWRVGIQNNVAKDA